MSTEEVQVTTPATEPAAEAEKPEAAPAVESEPAPEAKVEETPAATPEPAPEAKVETTPSEEPVATDSSPKPRHQPDETRSESDYDKRKRRRSRGLGDAVFCRPLEVVVRDDRVEQAIRQLKNRMAREGVLRELKNRRHYFKPSELKRIKSREAARRRRKQARQKTAR